MKILLPKEHSHPIFVNLNLGYFTQNQILEELEGYMTKGTLISSTISLQQTDLNQSQLTSLGPKLVHLMFGGTTASLRQLCIREIFKSCFFRDSSNQRSPVDLPMFSIETADEHRLLDLVSLLNIPKDLLINLHVELFRQRLCISLQHCAAVLRDNAIYGTINSDSDADSDLDENDSDLEYW